MSNLLSFFGSGIPAASLDVEFATRALELVKELEMEGLFNPKLYLDPHI